MVRRRRSRTRRGEFRVIYRIDDNRIVVDVIRIQHRRDVYRA
ncbi:type II toxin-antitoxin system RelE family toxin [Mobilicoccus massiliensis]|nr:type II toxin-antitoxin system RelE/ParE family toxin [Mobilicoccus massiliensis]